MTLQFWGRIDIMAILDNQHCLIRFLQPLLRPGDEHQPLCQVNFLSAERCVSEGLSIKRSSLFGQSISDE
jgi:hypothetical protein